MVTCKEANSLIDVEDGASEHFLLSFSLCPFIATRLLSSVFVKTRYFGIPAAFHGNSDRTRIYQLLAPGKAV